MDLGGEDAPFGPDCLLWDLAGDIRNVLSLQAAFVLQVAHPGVGAGVDQHSVFRTDPWGRAARSLHSVQLWVYGGSRAAEEGRRLRALHRTVTGTDARGRPYRALDPALYAWVHATAFPVFLRSCAYLDRPLDEAGTRRLYAEHLRLGRVLGLDTADMPPTPEAYWVYFAEVVREELELTVVAQELLDPARPVPPPDGAPAAVRLLWPVLFPPLSRLRVLFTVGLLPPAAREALGLRWTDADERRLRRRAALVRLIVPHLPERLRFLPLARRARRAARTPGPAGGRHHSPHERRHRGEYG
ncbi:DUF2236 domain-containing protein [Streptomyces sp. NA04227]|uniref:oxygenase MpaB family protein n=1 Tax=Streptomyces sp. NA04227 TaxID=2742136 RepID=UPI0015923DAE|nr:oxygenase MpaB family protein [Streptomyces sp. NA04227]QKW11251.1 DUF2236 domain-containing protein [Streptomyces sp. NA04227]